MKNVLTHLGSVGKMKEVWDTFQFSINGRQNEKRFKTIALLF